MRVLVACEYSGAVRDAFTALGHEAMSCDLLPTETLGPHYQGDVRDVLDLGWDVMIAHPPCTYLSCAGNKYFGAAWAERFPDRPRQREEALDFVRLLMDAPIERIAIENPIGTISGRIRKPDQIVHPWQFGHENIKPTCLWLKGLPKLEPTNIVDKGPVKVTKGGNRIPVWFNLPPSPDRWKIRSATFAGIARAMAEQWGGKHE